MDESKYYIIEFSTSSEVIGNKYPQVIGTLSSYVDKPSNKNSLYSFSDFKGEKIDYNPDLSGLRIGGKTKLTDFISCSLGPGRDLIVSNKCLTMLSSFSTSKFQEFDCVLTKQNDKFQYKWIHFVYELEKDVDYKSSIFWHPNDEINSKVGLIKNYDSLIGFYKKIDTFENLRARKIILNRSSLDFFIIGRTNQNYYVSEKLKETFEKENISGIDYQYAFDISFNP